VIYRFTVEFALEVPDEDTALLAEEALDRGTPLLREAIAAITGRVPLKEPGKPGVFVGIPAQATWDAQLVDWVSIATEDKP
jgi:hypothetical protein